MIVDNAGHEIRYRIPCVLSVKYEVAETPIHSTQSGVLTIRLGNVGVESSVDIGGVGTASIEDLMAEIAAARLRSSDR